MDASSEGSRQAVEGGPEAADRDGVAKIAATLVVAQAKIGRGRNSVMQWRTFCCSPRCPGKPFAKPLKPLSLAIIGQWTEHFEALLNSTSMSSIGEAESEHLGKDLPITLAEVANLEKKLLR